MACLLAMSPLAAGQGTESTYRLQPDDVLRIQVYREQETLAEVPVGRDGNIAAPFVGIIRVEGKTTAEVQQELTARYVQVLRLKDPKVSVIIVRYRAVRASVGGAVNRPGVYEMRPGDSLMALLTNGGGTVFDRADLRRATLRRKGSNELIPVDLYALQILGDTSQNYTIDDGDELNVPEETRNRILVQGSVAAPGLYPYKEPMTLQDAISQARGEIPRKSQLSKVIILRQNPGNPSQTIQITADYVRYVRKNDATQNVVLRPGDLVFVPQNNNPDFETISQLANTFFILDRLGGFLGFRLFGLGGR
mgnify:CR=1 FL=1